MRIRLLLLLVFLGMQFSELYSQKSNNAVLLVIDMQEEFTKKAMDSIVSGELIEEINDIIAAARPMEIIFIKADIKVLNISFKGIKVESAENLDLDGRLYRKKNDRIFMKDKSNAFTIEELSKLLEVNDIKEVYLVGIYLGECLSSTALDGVARGYDVTVIEEGVRSKKASKFAKLLTAIQEGGVDVVTLDEFIREPHEETEQ